MNNFSNDNFDGFTEDSSGIEKNEKLMYNFSDMYALDMAPLDVIWMVG